LPRKPRGGSPKGHALAEKRRALQSALLAWYEASRRDLPWRHTKDPYAIWLSEIMLQQTRVETVIPYYARFLEQLPTVLALAEAPDDQVMSLWSGLGYYRRARMLHEAARQVRDAGGALPRTARELGAIRGIGRYTAGAIASIAFGEAAPVVDGNVVRVLARLFAIKADVRGGPGLAAIWELAQELVPEERPGDWNQSLMELGATVCVPRNPRCEECPVQQECRARALGLVDSLPRLAPRTAAVSASLTALVATVVGRGEDRLVLARRRAGGLFGGLWEPPMVPGVDLDDAPAAFAALLGTKLPKLEARGAVTHVLTHRRLAVQVLSTELSRAPKLTLGAGLYEALELASLGSLGSRGMSTLARKVLARASVRDAVVVGPAIR
jgi:A/G-specific adenine glycosylase